MKVHIGNRLLDGSHVDATLFLISADVDARGLLHERSHVVTLGARPPCVIKAFAHKAITFDFDLINLKATWLFKAYLRCCGIRWHLFRASAGIHIGIRLVILVSLLHTLLIETIERAVTAKVDETRVFRNIHFLRDLGRSIILIHLFKSVCKLCLLSSMFKAQNFYFGFLLHAAVEVLVRQLVTLLPQVRRHLLVLVAVLGRRTL